MVDRVEINTDPNNNPEANADQEAHVAAMIAKADEGATNISGQPQKGGERVDIKAGQEAPAEETTVAERPDNIPEKFWDAEKGEVNVEALLKSQQDAESALRNKGKEKPEEGKEDDDVTPSQDNAVEAASAEFAEKGELSDETYEALAKTGLDRGMVDAYIAGQEAMVEKITSAAYGEFDGTEENFRAAQEWARANMSEGEIAAIDVQLGSDNPAIVAQGAKALAARYSADADVTPQKTVVGTGRVGAQSGSYFKSTAEMKAAMSSPQYKTDPAFRQEVADKISRASASGINLF